MTSPEAEVPAKKVPRKMVAVRLSPEGEQAIKDEAAREGLTASEMHRLLIREALLARATKRAEEEHKTARR